MKSVFAAFLFLISNVAIAADNVVIVLDGSGSMGDSMPDRAIKMDAAKEALKSVVLSLPKETTNVGLVCFPYYDWVYELGPIDEAKFTKAVDILRPNGGTPLGAYMKIGADALLLARKKDPYGNFRLIIITDGVAGDEGLVDLYISDILSRGIVVNTIGVNMAQDHRLARKTPYRAVRDTTSFAAAAKEFVSEASDDGTGPPIEEVVKEISYLPVESANLIITSISKIQNQPIGEKPSVEETADASYGTARVFDVDNGEPPPSSTEMLLKILGVVALIVVVILGLGYFLGR